MFQGKLVSTEIVRRDGVDYEKKSFVGPNDEQSSSERVVTKASYVKPIEVTTARLAELHELQDACVE